MAEVFDPVVFDPVVFDTVTGAAMAAPGVFDGVVFDSNVFDTASMTLPPYVFDGVVFDSNVFDTNIASIVGGGGIKFREAIVATLKNDIVMTSLLGSGDFRVLYRPGRIPEAFPVVTFFDFGSWPDANVPFGDRTVQFDVWGKSLEQAELIAGRIVQLIDFKESRRAGLTPWSVTQDLRLAQSFLTADRDDIADDGDTTRKTLEFRVLVYRQ